MSLPHHLPIPLLSTLERHARTTLSQLAAQQGEQTEQLRQLLAELRLRGEALRWRSRAASAFRLGLTETLLQLGTAHRASDGFAAELARHGRER